MSLVTVQIPPGLERNDTAYDTPGRWWDMNLVRWRSGSVVPVGGWQKLNSSALAGAVRKMHVWRDNANARWSLIGTASKLYKQDAGTTFTDITTTGMAALSSTVSGGYGASTYGASTYGTARSGPSTISSPYRFWTFSNWGEDVILTNNADGRLYYFDTSVGTAPAVISGAPTSNSAVIVTDERHVMAFGSGGYPYRAAWSSREDYTDWNFASTTNTAGYQDLAATTPIMKAVKVKEGILIFTKSEVFLGQYVGLPYIYGFQRVATAAMMHPDAVATFDGKAAWLSHNGFQLYAGGYVQTLPCPILSDIMMVMDETYGPYRVHGSWNGEFSEVWWFYPSTGNTECNRYVCWNYVDDWWSWGTMSRSAMVGTNVSDYPLAGDTSGNVYQHEFGWLDNGASRVGNVWIETGELGIGQGDKTIEVRQVLPATGHGTGSIKMSFYSRMTPEGAERTFGPYTPRSNGYTDVRVSGRETRVRFSNAADGDWGLGKMRFDVVEGTGR